MPLVFLTPYRRSVVIPPSTSDEYDPYWYDVVLLLHMDGTNGSTIFIDEKGHTVTPYSGASLTEDKVKYGTTSGNFLSTRYIAVSHTADLNITGDLTLEAWVYLTSSNATCVILTKGHTSGSRVPSYELSLVSGRPRFFVGPGSGTSGITEAASAEVLPINQWVHVAGTAQGNTLRIFVNGILKKTGTAGARGNNAVDLTIGRRNSNDHHLPGYMDEIRITKGVARYTSNFDVPTGPYPDSHSIDYYDPYTTLLMNMNGLDNGTTFTDEKGNSITRFGDVKTVTGEKKYGTASAYFDGVEDYLALGGSSDFAFGTGDFTIEGWFNNTGRLNQFRTIIGTYSPSNTSNVFSLYINTSNRLRLQIGASTIYDGTTNISLNTWYHFAITRTGTTLRAFINGVQWLSVTNSTNFTVADGRPWVGVEWDGNSGFMGYLDDLRITKGVARYTSTFTPPYKELAVPNVDPYWEYTKLLMHMDGANGSTTFVDEKGLTMSHSGAVQLDTSVKKYGTASAFFNPASNVLTSINTGGSQDFVLTSDFTIEAWVYPTNTAEWDTWGGPTILAFSSGGSAGTIQSYVLQFGSSGTGTTGKIRFAASGNNSGPAVATTNTVAANTWHHVAVTRSGNTMRIFINGVLEGTNASASGTIGNTAWQVHIGSHNYTDGQRPFRGYIDDLRITKGVARYTSNFKTPQTRLLSNSTT